MTSKRKNMPKFTNKELGVALREKMATFIAGYNTEHGFPPLQSEIAKELDTSRQTVRYHFDIMAAELKKYPQYARYFNQQKGE